MAKALGYSPGQQDAWSKQMDMGDGVVDRRRARVATTSPSRRWRWPARSSGRPATWASTGAYHLRPAHRRGVPGRVGAVPQGVAGDGTAGTDDASGDELVPMRTVLQWDKDDCAAVGLVKFDLLGLGMLEALHHCVDFVRGAAGIEVDLAAIPQDDEVYAMLCWADSVGVFQVESRADGHAALAAALARSTTWWSRWRSIRPGLHPGRVGAPVHPPPQWPGGPPTCTRC